VRSTRPGTPGRPKTIQLQTGGERDDDRRDFVDSSGAQSSIASAKRDNELTRALAVAWRTIDAIVEFIISEDLGHDRLVAIGAVIHDHDARGRVYAAEAMLDRGDPAEWLARRTAEARAQPALPADRSPRSGRASVGHSILATDVDPQTGEVLRAWGQSPEQLG
jgi:hypothetical protein